MNNYLKYNLKLDFKVMGIVVGIIVAFSLFLAIGTDEVGAVTYGFSLSFLSMLVDLWGVVFLIIIYFHLLKKDQSDVYGAMPIKKRVYFNTLLLRTIFVVGIPSLVIGVITYLYFDEVKNVDLIAQSLELNGIEVLTYNISSLLLDFGIFIFFIVVCGRVSTFVINILIVNFIRFGTILPMAEYGVTTYIILPQMVFAIVFFLLGKYLYDKRLSENIGNSYVFEKFDIVSTIIYSTILGTLVAISSVTIYDWMEQLIITNTIVVIFYIFFFICFIGYKKERINNLKFILIPFIASSIALILIQWVI